MQARPGTVIELRSDLDGEVAVLEVPEVTLRSVGTRRALRAAGRSAEDKATLVVRAPGVRVENVEFTGARATGGNGAGIRFEAGSLIVQDCSFRDNENGLLTAGRGEMWLAVRHCVFGASPTHMGRLHHQLYVGTIGFFELRCSRFGGGFRGHLCKSRARVNFVHDNRFDDGPDGAASYELELPEGGLGLLVRNLLVQSPRSDNPTLLSVGAEASPGGAPTDVWLLHNTFADLDSDRSGPVQFVRHWAQRLPPQARLVAVNNLFLGRGRTGLTTSADWGGNVEFPLSAAPPEADYRLGEPWTARAKAAPLPMAPAWWAIHGAGNWPEASRAAKTCGSAGWPATSGAYGSR